MSVDYRTHWYEYATAYQTGDCRLNIRDETIHTQLHVVQVIADTDPIGVVVVYRIAPDGDWQPITDAVREESWWRQYGLHSDRQAARGR